MRPTKAKEEVEKAALSLQGILTADKAPARAADRALRSQLLDWHGPLGWLTLAATNSAGKRKARNIEMAAPATLEIRLPAALAAGAELLTTGKLHPEKGKNGSVQLQVSTTKPDLSKNDPDE